MSHHDDRARFNIDVVIATGEPHVAGGDDEDLFVFMVYVLRRLSYLHFVRSQIFAY